MVHRLPNTKVFAATLLALANVTGTTPIKIALDTVVADLLPQGVTINLYNGDPILLQHLVTHTAGWPDGMCPLGGTILGDYTFPQMQDFLGAFKPGYGPGTAYWYSNQSFALLGTLVSHAFTGTTQQPTDWDTSYMQWPTLAVDHIALPLNLTSTQVDYSGVINRVLQSFTFGTQGQPYNWGVPPNWVLDSASLAAGSLSSTLADMLAFLEAQMSPPNSPIGKAISQTQTQQFSGIPMGLAWQIGDDFFSKDGLVGGYAATHPS